MQFVIGTAGHIDHGKTSLVKALTGKDTDTLPEEKLKSMTIDLGFAYLTEKITIIDVPGHEKFIKNMVAGVSAIDIGLLAVAADDGIMPQTIEHINILSHLGVKVCVVALTKIDTIDSELLDIAYSEIEDILKKSLFEKYFIIKTSIKNGTGIKELKKNLIAQSNNNNKNDRSFFYFASDRVFSMKGFGTVCTGTILSGHTFVGDELQIIPGNHIGKVRGIQSHGISVKEAKFGDRIALNLSNIHTDKLRRGSILVEPNKVQPIMNIIARVNMVNNTKWKLKNNQKIHLNIGTSQIIATAKKISSPLASSDFGNVLFNFENPIMALMDQKFIIRSLSPMETIGGCIVLHCQDVYSNSEIDNLLNNLSVDPAKRLTQLIYYNWKTPFSVSKWANIFNVSNEAILSFAKNERIASFDNFLFLEKNLYKSSKLILSIISDYHSANRYEYLIKTGNLEKISKMEKFWIDFVIKESNLQIEILENGYKLFDHKINIIDSHKALIESISRKLISSGFEYLTTSQLFEIVNKENLDIIHLMKKQKIIVEIKDNFWIHRNAKTSLVDLLKKHFMKNNLLTVSDFKKIINSSRKYSIPLLEYFDKNNFTVRINNNREKGTKIDI